MSGRTLAYRLARQHPSASPSLRTRTLNTSARSFFSVNTRPGASRSCAPLPTLSSPATNLRTFIKAGPAEGQDATDLGPNSIPDPCSEGTYGYPPVDSFLRRHVGPDANETTDMLQALSPPASSLDSFVAEVIPADILSKRDLTQRPLSWRDHGPEALSESEVLKLGRELSDKCTYHKSFQGCGYYGTHTPGVIKRNVFENPAWYTSYTPYQPEISQGRLEALLNFQTMVSDLTALPIANASLLDEGTAAAEAMALSFHALPPSRTRSPGASYVVSHRMHPQTIAVLRTRAAGLPVTIKVLDLTDPESIRIIDQLGDDLVGLMVQYPDTRGAVDDFKSLTELVHSRGALVAAGTDLLALTMLTPPGEWGADIAFGSSQRFGVPMGFGGPHAAFFAVKDEHKRRMPGRLIGVSKDRLGNRALRLALQTREQHIRREKATSNVCTAQALLANMASFYAVYHGPKGLTDIAKRVIIGARAIHAALEHHGFTTHGGRPNWDTVVVQCPAQEIVKVASGHHIGIRPLALDRVSITVDETTTFEDLRVISRVFRKFSQQKKYFKELESKFDTRKRRMDAQARNQQLQQEEHTLEGFDQMLMTKIIAQEREFFGLPPIMTRTSPFLEHPVFNSHHSETEMLRYIRQLESKDLSLVHSMIPLGSCTMKLTGSTEMELVSMPWSSLHPHAHKPGGKGIREMIKKLTAYLADITGMYAVSFQPNSGAQGEYAGLMAIRKYLASQGKGDRDVCLIPVSAHGTNPASAAMAGMKVVPIKCDTKTGNLDLEDLAMKCKKHSQNLAAIMITYPSTYGVFEENIKEVCELVHSWGGQVYMDGANMNAQIGLCSPGEIGADVCHLNLHKTFCIPHGGGGPGVGPICVKQHLEYYLPSTEVVRGNTTPEELYSVSSAPHGSASILPISWAYCLLLGPSGLTHATKLTLLSANYLLARLKKHYDVLYTNEQGRCAHEFILDVRPFLKTANISALDIAKRLQDYGFHAPTMSFPLAGTLMIEPTESESVEELDRFVDAMVGIREEIREIEEGRAGREVNVLKMAPHPVGDLLDLAWEERGYTREKAVYPRGWVRERKFWPSVARVDDKHGDMNLFCTCPPVEDTTGEPRE